MLVGLDTLVLSEANLAFTYLYIPLLAIISALEAPTLATLLVISYASKPVKSAIPLVDKLGGKSPALVPQILSFAPRYSTNSLPSEKKL